MQRWNRDNQLDNQSLTIGTIVTVIALGVSGILMWIDETKVVFTSVAFVAGASVLITTFSSRMSRTAVEFLFGGNNIIAAICSTVGSVYSLTFVAALILFSRHYGLWHPLLVASFVVGGFGIMAKIMTLEGVIRYFRASERESVYRNKEVGFLLPEFMGDILGGDERKSERAQLKIGLYVFYLIYSFSLLVLELATIRIVFSGTALAAGLPLGHLFVVFPIYFLCLLYVFQGGFRGVLWVDVFQVLVVLTGAGTVVVGSYLLGGAVAEWFNVAGMLELAWQRATSVTGDRRAVWRGVNSVVVGAIWFVAANDFWVRIAGTLHYPSADVYRRRVRVGLGAAAAMLCIGLTIVSIAGFSLIDLSAQGGPPAKEFLRPLQLIEDFVGYMGRGVVAFALIASLTAVAMTTLNTYVLSVVQLLHGLTRDATNVDVNPRLSLLIVYPGAVVVANFVTVAALYEALSATVMLLLIAVPPLTQAVRKSSRRVVGRRGDGAVRMHGGAGLAYVVVALVLYTIGWAAISIWRPFVDAIEVALPLLLLWFLLYGIFQMVARRRGKRTERVEGG